MKIFQDRLDICCLPLVVSLSWEPFATLSLSADNIPLWKINKSVGLGIDTYFMIQFEFDSQAFELIGVYISGKYMANFLNLLN